MRSPEDYAIALGRRFLQAAPKADSAQIRVEQYAWDRIATEPDGHDHAFVRRGDGTRTTVVTVGGRGDAEHVSVVSGLTDLVLLKSTGSEFRGFLRDEYTTLQETDDRIMATSLVARWRYASAEVDWNAVYDSVRATLLEAFATTYSRALQETLYLMGTRVLETTTTSSRSGSPRPTGTTSSSTSSRSGCATTVRCSSPPTGRTA